MQCPLLVMAEICNLPLVPAIACLIFAIETMGSLTPTNSCWQTGRWFNVHLRNSTHVDESPCLWNTEITVYIWLDIWTQATAQEVRVCNSRLSCWNANPYRDVQIINPHCWDECAEYWKKKIAIFFYLLSRFLSLTFHMIPNVFESITRELQMVSSCTASLAMEISPKSGIWHSCCVGRS